MTIIDVPLEGVTAPTAYCSRDDARSAGARGTDAEIDAAILTASERVDLYTAQVFVPTELTIEAELDREGYAYLHRRVLDVASVSWVGASAPIDSTGYRVGSSTAIGGLDRIELAGALGWADLTVLGAEPWNGGWLGFASRNGTPRVSVVGTFGWETVPGPVRDATAQLAAYLTGTDADTSDPTITTDVEGNVMPVVESARRPPAGTADERESDTVRDRTTGSQVADVLLAPFVREPVRIR